ncbi:MAG: hypothetical protein MHPSP_000736 [Paramarteilia canceri]
MDDEGNLWDGISEELTLLSCPSSIQNIRPYQPDGSDKIFYCSDNLSFLSELSINTQSKPGLKKKEAHSAQNKVKRAWNNSTPMDRTFSSENFETPEKLDSISSHMIVQKDKKLIEREEKTIDGLYELPIDYHENIHEIASQEQMYELSINGASQNNNQSIKEPLQKKIKNPKNINKHSKHDQLSKKHLFGIALREKEHYDLKKSELKYIRGYLKNLLLAIKDHDPNDPEILKYDSLINFVGENTTNSEETSTSLSQNIKSIQNIINKSFDFKQNIPSKYVNQNTLKVKNNDKVSLSDLNTLKNSIIDNEKTIKNRKSVETSALAWDIEFSQCPKRNSKIDNKNQALSLQVVFFLINYLFKHCLKMYKKDFITSSNIRKKNIGTGKIFKKCKFSPKLPKKPMNIQPFLSPRQPVK